LLIPAFNLNRGSLTSNKLEHKIRDLAKIGEAFLRKFLLKQYSQTLFLQNYGIFLKKIYKKVVFYKKCSIV